MALGVWGWAGGGCGWYIDLEVLTGGGHYSLLLRGAP